MASNNSLHPVFITAHPRSGTSLLYRTLLKHSSFTPKEFCMEETGVFRHPLIMLQSNSKMEPLKKYMLNDEEAFNEFLQSTQTIKRRQKVIQSLKLPVFLDDETVWNISGDRTVVQKYFGLAQKARGCKRLVEKTPNHLLKFQRILSSFSNASILVIVRHPVEIYSSYRKRLQENPDAKWLQLGLDEFIEQYQTYASATTSLNAFSQSYVFRYEDFVQSPETSFREMCRFLGEPFEETPIREDAPSLKIEGVNPNLSKKIQKETKTWSDYLTEDEAHRIETKLADIMTVYNYPSLVNRA